MVRAAVLVRLENLRGDDERLIGPTIADQGMLRVHPRDPEKLAQLLGCAAVEPRQALPGLLDAALPALLPERVGPGAVGRKSEDPPQQLLTRLLGTAHQSVTRRARCPDHPGQHGQGGDEDPSLEKFLVAGGALLERQHPLANRRRRPTAVGPALETHGEAAPRWSRGDLRAARSRIGCQELMTPVT